MHIIAGSKTPLPPMLGDFEKRSRPSSCDEIPPWFRTDYVSIKKDKKCLAAQLTTSNTIAQTERERER
jgi:Fe-S-cluster containining protein